MTSIDLSAATVRRAPFPCFTVAQAISDELEHHLLGWFEDAAPWKLAVTDFYEQYEFDIRDVIEVPEPLRPLFSPLTLAHLRADVGALLGTSLGSQIDITAHKLNRTQKIRVHNDARPDGETHRLLVQLNREWHEANGGFLMLFGGAESDSVSDVIVPPSRCSFGF